jgi:hypothetical protein
MVILFAALLREWPALRGRSNRVAAACVYSSMAGRVGSAYYPADILIAHGHGQMPAAAQSLNEICTFIAPSEPRRS